MTAVKGEAHYRCGDYGAVGTPPQEALDSEEAARHGLAAYGWRLGARRPRPGASAR